MLPPLTGADSANFPEKNSCGLRSLYQKLRKGRIPKKLAFKSKKLELNCTNLELKGKKTRSDCAKMPDPSVSSGKSKIRQLGFCLTLDQVETLFSQKKGPVNAFLL